MSVLQRRKRQSKNLSDKTKTASPMGLPFGAGGRIRTPDLLITNQLLYQLSYTSATQIVNKGYYTENMLFCQHFFRFKFFAVWCYTLRKSKKEKQPAVNAAASLLTVKYGYRTGFYSQAALNSVQTRTCSSSASGVIFWIISILSAVKSSGRVRNGRYSSEISASASLLVL